MKTMLMGLALVLVMLTACEGYTPEAVLPAAEIARLGAIATATMEAEAARAAMERANATAEAEAAAANATATAEANLIELARISATATAEALAVEQAQWAAAATATAVAVARDEQHRAEIATATAVAFQPTATAIAQAIVLREMEIERAQRLADSEAKREKMLLPLVTYGPWVLLAVMAGVLVYALLRVIAVAELRARAIQRDARGDAPLLVLPHGRGVVVYDGDRAFGPAFLAANERVSMPALVDEQQQATVTMRDQAVDLATRGLPKVEDHPGMSARQRTAARQLGLAGSPAQVRVVEAQTVRNWLQDVTPQALALTMGEVDGRQ